MWTTVGIFTLYNSVNMYLYIQGSEIAFGFPDFSKVARDTVSLYSMLLFIPSYYVLLRLTNYCIYDSNENTSWLKKLPIAFNLSTPMNHRVGKEYQRFFFFFFLVFPMLIQFHCLKEFFETTVYTRDFIDGERIKIAEGMYQHLFCFEPFLGSFENNYIFGDPNCEPVTFFPAYESWAFLLLEIGLFYFLIFTIRNLFQASKRKTLD